MAPAIRAPNVKTKVEVLRETVQQGNIYLTYSKRTNYCEERPNHRFGVCCLFQLAKVGEVNQNCTYVQNPGYPSAYAETSAVKYTIKKCTDGEL